MSHKWKTDAKSWGLFIVIIHWLTALCVAGMFVLGLWMSELEYYSKWYETAPFIHKSVGISLLFLTIIRMFYRVVSKSTAPLSTHKKIEIKLAHLMHKALYAGLFTVMLSGYLISTAKGMGVSVFGIFEIPALPWRFYNQEDLAGDIHFWLACFLIGFASLHAIAALKHHLIEKDDTLKRMLGRNLK